MNNKYVIRVTHPLLRPGLEIETEASKKYVVDVVNTLMTKVREINNGEKEDGRDGRGTGGDELHGDG
jgi:hypothetical protein